MYSVYLISKETGTKYVLHEPKGTSKFLLELSLSESKDQLSQTVKMDLANLETQKGLLYYLVRPQDRVIVFAEYNGTVVEVFRGFVWKKNYKSAEEKVISITCFDNSVLLNQSEDTGYFPAGTGSQAIVQNICDKWGIPLSYNYASVELEAITLQGNLADLIVKDVLHETANQSGVDYVVRSVKDVLTITEAGSNSVVQKLSRNEIKNVLHTESEVSLDELVTKVVITASNSDQDSAPNVEAVIEGQTDVYGTLQKIVRRSSESTLEEAQKEANRILKEQGKPKWNYTVVALDNPFIHKGDKVEITAGDMNRIYLVESIRHEHGNNSKMTLELVNFE